MAGLMNKPKRAEGGSAPPQQERPTAAQRNPMNAPETEQGANVTPEEQAEYDQFVANATEIMYDEQTMPQILQRIHGSPNKAEAVANVTAMLVMRLEDSARQEGMPIEGDVKFHGGVNILELLVDLTEAAGIHEFSPEEIEQATLAAMDIYREARQADGTLPSEEIAEDLDLLVAAEEQGALGELVPGAEQYAQMAEQRHGGGGQQQGGEPKRRRGLMA